MATLAPEERASTGSGGDGDGDGDVGGGGPGARIPKVDDAPALTKVAFAAEVVAQTLEGIFVYLQDGTAHLLHPIHAPTLRLGWRADLQPADVILGGARRYGLDRILVHST